MEAKKRLVYNKTTKQFSANQYAIVAVCRTEKGYPADLKGFIMKPSDLKWMSDRYRIEPTHYKGLIKQYIFDNNIVPEQDWNAYNYWLEYKLSSSDSPDQVEEVKKKLEDEIEEWRNTKYLR